MSLVGTTVGRIRIVERLGQGGMGEVFIGWDETLERKVALKAIRGDQRFDTEAKARFLREARILSQLDHPGICRIFELVQGEQDSDFLVLELLDGTTLQDELKAGMELSFRLYIAEKVAEALAAAHSKGIVHRDLKPENVMLTRSGEVKVLDFGLAQTVDIGSPLEPVSTAAGFDSPSEDHPDEGSFETPPTRAVEPPTQTADPPTVTLVDASATEESGLDCQDLPADGSENSTVILGGANAEPQQLGPAYRADGESATRESPIRGAPISAAEAANTVFKTRAGVVMGTVAYMSPEQARGEPASAAGDMFSFGLMLQEMVTGKPAYDRGLAPLQILARAAVGDTEPVEDVDPDLATLIGRLKSVAPEARPSALESAERLWHIRGKRKRWIRNIALGLAVFGLCLGAVKYTLDLRNEREEAVQARREAEEVSGFLVSLFDVSAPGVARGRDISARDLLDAGARRIAGLASQPLSQARMMLTIGRVYRQLGAYEEARPMLVDALAIRRQHMPQDPDTVAYIDQLARLHHDLAELDEAEALFRESLELRREQLGPDHPHVAASLANLAVVYRARGDDQGAEPFLRQALRILRQSFGDHHPDVARSLNNLADLLRAQGELKRAEPYFRQALEIQQRLLGADHPDLITALNNLALVLHRQNHVAEAESMYQRSLELSLKVLGEQHPDVATILNNLAELYRHTGRFTDAEPLYQRALQIQKLSLGGGHPARALTLSNLAQSLHDRGRPAESEPLFRQALDLQEQSLGKDHGELAVTLNLLADCLVDLGRSAEAEPLYQRALRIQEPLGDDSPGSLMTWVDLGNLCRQQGRTAAAESLYEQAVTQSEQYIERRPESRQLRRALASALLGRGQLRAQTGAEAEARTDWTRAARLAWAEEDADMDIPKMVADLEIAALAYLLLGDSESARPLVETLLQLGCRPPEVLELGIRLDLVEAGEMGR